MIQPSYSLIQIPASVYLSFAFVVLLGIIIKKQKWFVALPTSLLGTTSFFLITNWAVWQFSEWYPHTLAGLLASYAEGLPFVKNNFAGDLTYTFLFFGAAELAIFLARKMNIKNKEKLFAQGKI